MDSPDSLALRWESHFPCCVGAQLSGGVSLGIKAARVGGWYNWKPGNSGGNIIYIIYLYKLLEPLVDLFGTAVMWKLCFLSLFLMNPKGGNPSAEPCNLPWNGVNPRLEWRVQSAGRPRNYRDKCGFLSQAIKAEPWHVLKIYRRQCIKTY